MCIKGIYFPSINSEQQQQQSDYALHFAYVSMKMYPFGIGIE